MEEITDIAGTKRNYSLANEIFPVESFHQNDQRIKGI